MGLLSRIKSILGFGASKASASRAGGKPAGADGKCEAGRRGEGAGQGARRSRAARPSDERQEGAQRGGQPRNRRPDRGDRPERGERPPRERGPRRERSGEAPRAPREGGRDFSHRERGPRRERGEGRPQQGSTPAGANRPGGAFTEEQLKAFAEAHAAWDPATYVVPEAEGKKRFVDFGLPSEILHAVADLGFQYCTPIQAQSLEFSLAGKNVAGRAQTGTGKTAAFLIAVLTRYLRTPEKRNLQPGTPRALILAPTRELVIQICKDAEALGKYCGNVRSLAVYGGMDYDRQRRELEEAPVDLLVATPGRLKDYMRSRVVDLRQVDTLVIDEADRMLDMGFIPDVRAIVNRLPDRDHRCTMLYSATLNETVMNLAAMWMRDPVRVEIEAESLATDTVRQIVYIARSEEKFTLLYNHLARNPEARTIIFCNRKFSTERIAESLRRRGISCEVLSGDVNQVKRLKILEAFRAGAVRTVVATDVAGRGIHVDDIAFVINYDFPYEPEDYVHRIGRTGRAGHTGTAISFADEDESFIIPDIEKYINEPLKCTMPEEWMYAELPPPASRQRRERSAAKAAPAADAPAAVEAPAEPAAEMASTPEATPVATPEMSVDVETPAEAVVSAEPAVTSEPVASVEPTAPEVLPEMPAEVALAVEVTLAVEAAPVVVPAEMPIVEAAPTEVAPVEEAPAPVTPEPAVEAPVADVPPVSEPAMPEVAAAEAVAEAITEPVAQSPAKEPLSEEKIAARRAKARSRHERERRKRQREREAAQKRQGEASITENPTARPEKPAKPERPPRAPRLERTERRPERNRPPRRSRPPQQHWARTQADGPRDGSESHHAAPITARPIYAPGKRGPIADEWSPGQN